MIIWCMTAAACLTLAGLHHFIGLEQRGGSGHLLLVSSALGAAPTAGCELSIMRAETATFLGIPLAMGYR
jgi:uncharacterized membrane protein